MKRDHDHNMAKYYDIERKTEIAWEISRRITVMASEQAKCEDIHKVLGCVGDLDR